MSSEASLDAHGDVHEARRDAHEDLDEVAKLENDCRHFSGEVHDAAAM